MMSVHLVGGQPKLCFLMRGSRSSTLGPHRLEIYASPITTPASQNDSAQKWPLKEVEKVPDGHVGSPSRLRSPRYLSAPV